MQSRYFIDIPRLIVVLSISLLLAFMPFSVNLQKYRITLERNEAHAVAPVFAGALAFLEECAAAAGFASAGDFIATGAGITAVGSGLTIGTSAGINLGDTASNNLGHLIDAADYPAWDTLSSSEQTNWGSADNYNAAKYNSLMAAFGLETDYQNYQSMWGTGQSFEFSASGQSKLEQIGDIGQNWIDGIGNSVSDLKNLVNKQQVVAWAPLAREKFTKDPNDQSWPSNVPSTIYYQISTGYTYKYNYNGSLQTVQFQTSAPVCMFSFEYGGYTRIIQFSKDSFQYKRANWTTWQTATTVTNTANVFSYNDSSHVIGDGVVENSTLNNGTFNLQSGSADEKYVLESILYGTSETENNEISGYPETEIDNGDLNQIIIVYPEDGITQTIDWQDFLTSDDPGTTDPDDPEQDGTILSILQHIDSDLHKFNFYNNGDLKVHDEGVFTELSDIYSLLMEISGKLGNWGDIVDAPEIIGDLDFDDLEDKIPNLLDTIKDLAPFGSILLLTEIYTILSDFAQIDEPVLTFPFDFGGLPGQDTELTIDLSWLDDIKPVINFFCILMLLLAITHATIRIVELEAAS